jgi:hypothetical protein
MFYGVKAIIDKAIWVPMRWWGFRAGANARSGGGRFS